MMTLVRCRTAVTYIIPHVGFVGVDFWGTTAHRSMQPVRARTVNPDLIPTDREIFDGMCTEKVKHTHKNATQTAPN